MATRAVKEVVVMGGGLMGTGIAQVLLTMSKIQRGSYITVTQKGGGTGTAEGGPR